MSVCFPFRTPWSMTAWQTARGTKRSHWSTWNSLLLRVSGLTSPPGCQQLNTIGCFKSTVYASVCLPYYHHWIISCGNRSCFHRAYPPMSYCWNPTWVCWSCVRRTHWSWKRLHQTLLFVLCSYCPLVRHQQNDVIGNMWCRLKIAFRTECEDLQ